VKKNERMLITTITKRSSEELTDYLLENWVKVKYLHSEVETLERLEILKELREWKIDVIVWVNLLREWLDLPEVSKICILDADKMWFLRSETSLIQIIWRAARNVNGKVYMYVEKMKEYQKIKSEDVRWWEINIYDWVKDKSLLLENLEKEELHRIDAWKLVNSEWLIISEAMRKAINLTNYRRSLQKKYNQENWITPKTVFSNIKDIWVNKKSNKLSLKKWKKWILEKEIKRLELEMDVASTNLDFERAAELRDMILELKAEK
jgi:excinuclease ABC subunit B